MTASRAAAAQALIAERFADALPGVRPTRDVVSTGIAALERILPGGGLPRGQLTAWAAGIGAVALLRAACVHVVAGGERAVWIDTPHVVTGPTWRTGPLLLRPHGPVEALRAAEILARSGGFALLVLDLGERVVETPVLVRLARAAREGGAALVALTGHNGFGALRVVSRPRLADYGWRRSRAGEPGDVRSVAVQVEARTSGWRAETVLTLPVRYDDPRLSLAPQPDRRGGR